MGFLRSVAIFVSGVVVCEGRQVEIRAELRKAVGRLAGVSHEELHGRGTARDRDAERGVKKKTRVAGIPVNGLVARPTNGHGPYRPKVGGETGDATLRETEGFASPIRFWSFPLQVSHG